MESCLNADLDPPRIALYSHDTMGLGHIRRNQLIAMALSEPPLNATVLLVTGVREGGAFPVPHGIDSVVLPAYRKASDGAYSPRSLRMNIDQLVDFRAGVIDLAMKRFKPHLFVADNVPSGALGELLPALRRLRRDPRTRTVLGLRDILDCPEAIRHEWALRGNFETIRKWYDAIWVYGDPRVFPTATVYEFPPEIGAMTTYTGYLDPFRSSGDRIGIRGLGDDRRQVALCSVGGGQDGLELACHFASAPMPEGMRGLIVTGPLMPREGRDAVLRLIKGRNDIALVDGVCDLVSLLEGADRVVAMAGYNSANEILASGRPVLFVPRSTPRSEQLIRAQRLQQLGLASCLTDTEVSAQAIGEWLANPATPGNARTFTDFRGLESVVRLAGEATHAIRSGACSKRGQIVGRS